jgi:hypothetical protein
VGRGWSVILKSKLWKKWKVVKDGRKEFDYGKDSRFEDGPKKAISPEMAGEFKGGNVDLESNRVGAGKCAFASENAAI